MAPSTRDCTPGLSAGRRTRFAIAAGVPDSGFPCGTDAAGREVPLVPADERWQVCRFMPYGCNHGKHSTGRQ